MDPQALIERLALMIIEASNDNATNADEIHEAFTDLLEWFNKGGYVPNVRSAIAALNGYLG